MTKIVDKLNSDYISSQNALHKQKGEIVLVYVESEEDIPFWKSLFDEHGITTKINPASATSLNKGKQELLKQVNATGKSYLLCMDSDYDYLLDGATANSKTIKENPYIFHTYTYSIENYRCVSDSLGSVLLKAVLKDEEIVDFERFMHDYSHIIYELFLYSFFYHKKHQIEKEEVFSISDFCGVIKFRSEIQDIVADLEALKTAVRDKIQTLTPIGEEDRKNLGKALAELGVMPENTYLFVHGHTLQDNVIVMLLNPIYTKLKNKKLEDITTQAKSNEETKNQRKQYLNDISTVKTALHHNENYRQHWLYDKIKQDIKKYISLAQ